PPDSYNGPPQPRLPEIRFICAQSSVAAPSGSMPQHLPCLLQPSCPLHSPKKSHTMLAEIHAFLGCRTPHAWVTAALCEPEIMLLDHKNCEFKAASTALSMIARYNNHIDLVSYMSRLAREEL